MNEEQTLSAIKSIAEKHYKEQKKTAWLKGPLGDIVPEKDGALFEVIDSAHQRLWFRIGPVFNGNVAMKEPALWIEYQRYAAGSPMQGPVLMSLKVFKQFLKYVEGCSAAWKRELARPNSAWRKKHKKRKARKT